MHGVRGANGLPLRLHMCSAKPNTKKYKSLVKEAVGRNSSVGACNTQQAVVGEAVEAGNISET